MDFVGGGTKALVEAKTLQKSKRKWCCCAIIGLLAIIAIVIVVVSCAMLQMLTECFWLEFGMRSHALGLASRTRRSWLCTCCRRFAHSAPWHPRHRLRHHLLRLRSHHPQSGEASYCPCNLSWQPGRRRFERLRQRMKCTLSAALLHAII